MNLEDLIVSTISDAKPMMILALCTIVLFVIVASLIEAWLAKARKAKSEADTLPSGPEASQRSVEKSEAVEQAVDNAGGSHRSDFSYRLLGEAEYKEIWKKPSRRRF